MKNDIANLLPKLTKKELIKLILNSSMFILITPEKINRVRADTLREKADQAYQEWETLMTERQKILESSGKTDSFADDLRICAQAEQHWKKYTKLWDQADILEISVHSNRTGRVD
jgi:hypothetical protein